MPSFDRRQMLMMTGLAIVGAGVPTVACTRSVQDDPTRLAVDFTGQSPAGSLLANLQGAPRLDVEEGTTVRVGARVEGVGRNLAWSTAMQGSAVGPWGDGGALPQGWRLEIPAGVAVEVRETSDEDIVLRFFGTAAQGGSASLAFGPADAARASAGQDWTGSFESKLESPATGVRAFEIWMMTGGERVAETFDPQSDVPWPVEIRREASAGVVSHGLGIQVAAGSAIDVSLRLRRPQLEPGSQRSSFMPSARGDGRRTADHLALSGLDILLDGTAWSASVAFRPGPRPSGTLREWTTADGRRLTLYLQNYSVRLETATGETVGESLSLGRVCRYGLSCVALTLDGATLSARLNGGPIASAPSAFGIPAQDLLGSGDRGALGGWIAEGALYARGLSADELRDVSASGAATLSDGFDRENGVLTGDDAPTGQTYGGVELGEQAAVAELQIVSRAVIARDSGAAVTAAYSGMTFDANPRAMRLIGRVAEGEGNDAWALITNPHGFDDVTDITADSFHLVFTTTQADLGIFQAGALSYAGTPAYPAPLSSEGVHHMGVRIGSEAAILEMPDGRLLRYVNPTLMSKSGPHWVMEIFRYGTGTPRCAFLAVQVEV